MAPTAARAVLYTHYYNVFVCYGCQRVFVFLFFNLRTDVDAFDCKGEVHKQHISQQNNLRKNRKRGLRVGGVEVETLLAVAG